MSVELEGRNLLSISDLNREETEAILAQAESHKAALGDDGSSDVLRGRILETWFFEPSTRTRGSFESAMLRLGGGVISVPEAAVTSSAAKGEPLRHTGLMVSDQADIAVIRHSEVGSAMELADGASIPVINGGDGDNEHPTQTLLDLYTIWERQGSIDDLHIAMAGDLKHGRTVHSLALGLSRFNNVRIRLISPIELRFPLLTQACLKMLGVTIEETTDLRAAEECSVLYMTRIQRERFADPAEYEELAGSYVLDRGLAEQMSGTLIMHPMPIVDEILPEVESLSTAIYIEQAANGVPVRMALLSMLLGKA